MNETIEKFGAYVGSKTRRHPKLVRNTLATAYRAVGFQAAHLPSRQYMPSREYLQGYTATLLGNILRHPENSAVVNIFMSCEIFHALGINVSAPEALSLYVTNTAMEQPFIEAAEENGASENFCSFHRTLMGFAETGVLRAPMLIANTTLACDANQLSFRHLAGIWNVPQFIVDVPYDPSEDAVQYVADQLRDLGKLTSELSHRKLTEEMLQEAVARSIRTQESFKAYLELRPYHHLPEIMTPELLNAISNHLYIGSKQGETYTQQLLKDIKQSPSIGSRIRLLWMHVMPNAQEPLKAIFQGNERVEVLGCDLAYDNFVQMDSKHPYESMARRVVQSSYNGSGLRRIEKTLEYARQMHADGVVVFCQWGCKQTQGLALTAKNRLEEAGFPTLLLDGDACDRTNEASGQLSTRSNAFLETLEARK